ncbi:MAG: acyl--CoA ligase [Crenarchaeota archaeon]|nr:acyl--CoA ligase [Thermoproteota archaeon]
MPRGCGYPESMVEALLCHAAQAPEAVAVEDTEGRRLTYSGLLRAAQAAAGLLAERFNVSAGDVVAVAPINTVDAAVALYGVWMAGAAAAVVDPLSHSMDLDMQLEQLRGRLRLFITHEGLGEAHCSVARRHGAGCVEAERLAGEAAGRGAWEGYHRPRGWMDSIIYFYAGIAGRTLPVVHSHGGVAASAHTVAEHYGLDGGDAVFVSAPVSHALGLQVSMLAALYAGGRAVLYTKRGRLDPRDAAEKLASSGAAMVLGAPGFYQALLGAGYKGHRGLRYAVSAGAPLPVETQRSWLEATGVELLQLYGMTEAAPLTATLPGDNPPGSIGRPMPGVEARLVDPEDPGRPAEGGVGELLARGPMVMRGYGDPEETRRALLPGGWLRTGDILAVDGEGRFYFRGVRKRMLKYKGYPIFPRDLEAILERHPAVARAVVEGEPAGELGQVPVARVWLKPGARASERELLEWVNSRVAGYKQVRRLVIEGEAEATNGGRGVGER